MKKTFLLIAGMILAVVILLGATVAGYTDWIKVAAPGNPASTRLRMYADSTSGNFACINSTGAACYFGATPGSAIWSGLANPNGADIAPHTMTNDALPSPYVASAVTTAPCGAGAGEAFGASYLAFDGNATTFWAGDNFCGSWALKLDLGPSNSTGLASYQITERAVPTGVPGAWTFQGSNNDSTWTTLDTESGITWSLPATNRNFPVNASTAFRYFRLVATTVVQACCRPEIAEMNLIPVAFTGGVTGDFYYQTALKQWFGPRPAGVSPSWPTAGATLYSVAFTAQTSVTVAHNINTTHPVVQVYDSTGLQLIPESVTITDSNTVTITFAASTTGQVVVTG